MDWNEAIALLHGADWRHSKIGLDRMKALMNTLGNPQKKLRFIHIAGTNGKGSTCSMVRSILTEAGFKTGLYISPHLFSFNERISVDGADISDDNLRRISEKIRTAVTCLNEEPTDFEMITAMALCYFYEKGCDYVVLEVGMGGRLDATNIIGAPEVAAIMSIGLDHTEILGDTEELIAAEKAGIIKKGAPLVVLDQKASVLHVVSDRFREVNGDDADVPLTITNPKKITIPGGKLDGKRVVITGKLEHFHNREALQRLIEQNGGIVLSSVTKNVDILVNNDYMSTSTKNVTAKKLRIPILSEDEFLTDYID